MADNRPEKTLTLESGTVLKMTYTIFNDLLRFLGTVDEAVNSAFNSQDTRDLIVRRLLTEGDKPVEDVDQLIPVEQLDALVDIFEIDLIVAWVMEHVTYFFTKMAERVQASTAKNPKLAQKMMTTSSDPSESGTEA